MVAKAEIEKYEAIWQCSDYKAHSPGEEFVELFGEVTGANLEYSGATVIDFGCGDGRGGHKISETFGLSVDYLDLVDVLEVPREHSTFLCQPLWSKIRGTWDYGFCCDVMEHIPPEFTMLCARNMLEACTKGVFFSISTVPDNMGRLIRQPLHLTVQPFPWWKERLGEIGNLVESRDFLNCGIFYVREGNVLRSTNH